MFMRMGGACMNDDENYLDGSDDKRNVRVD